MTQSLIGYKLISDGVVYFVVYFHVISNEPNKQFAMKSSNALPQMTNYSLKKEKRKKEL